jgi:NADH-quinone oxidoreductase subunit M
MSILILILFPLIFAAILAADSRYGDKSAGKVALIVQGVLLLLICNHLGSTKQFVIDWMPDANLHLRFQWDGLSSLFALLTGIVTLAAQAALYLSRKSDRRMLALIFILESALIGVFTARHFIPFFLCWEMTLIPAWLLIRQWGGAGAPKAALRFFLMTLGGSAFMLVGFLALQLSVGTMDFDALGKLASQGALAEAMEKSFAFTGKTGHMMLIWLALAVFLGVAVKIPIVPFHAWLPAAYAEAPTPVTMLLTGLLSKMGVYAMLRIFLPVFPEVLPALAPFLTWLAVATILLGAVAALAQTDLKRMLAYSSVNHLGYCALAIAACAASTTDRDALSSAISGTVLQAFNHGIIASALFFGISILETRSHGHRGLNDFGGLRAQTPVFCGLFGLAVFASLGLPGLSGFVGEFLIFNGAFALVPGATALSVLGLLLTAVFLLRMMRKVFWGPLKPQLSKWQDLRKSERLVFVGLILLIVLYGLFPSIPLDLANPAIVELLDLLHPLP